GSSNVMASSSSGVTHADPVEAARRAILEIQRFGMVDQAKAWWSSELNVGIESAILDACYALSDIAPALARPKGKSIEEDRVTKLLVELLRQALRKLGWQVSSQEHGGFTIKD